MKTFKRTLLAIISGVILVSCSTQPAAIPETAHVLPRRPEPVIAISSLDALMRDYDRLSHLSGTELLAEYQTASLDFSRTKSDPDRIRLVILLALPDTSFHDVQAALKLLNDGAVQDSGLRSFAGLIGVFLRQQQQSERTAHDIAQMLREEKKHSASLQGKIKAITNMEKSLILRDRR
jgi:hypothetical protein